MRQSYQPCHPVRDANLSCRYESFITTAVFLPTMCLCECCDEEVPRRMCWLPPDYSVARLTERPNHLVRNRCRQSSRIESPGRVVGCDMAEWNHVSETRKVHLWICRKISQLDSSGPKVNKLETLMAVACWSCCTMDISFGTDAHTANRS